MGSALFDQLIEQGAIYCSSRQQSSDGGQRQQQQRRRRRRFQHDFGDLQLDHGRPEVGDHHGVCKEKSVNETDRKSVEVTLTDISMTETKLSWKFILKKRHASLNRYFTKYSLIDWCFDILQFSYCLCKSIEHTNLFYMYIAEGIQKDS